MPYFYKAFVSMLIQINMVNVHCLDFVGKDHCNASLFCTPWRKFRMSPVYADYLGAFWLLLQTLFKKCTSLISIGSESS